MKRITFTAVALAALLIGFTAKAQLSPERPGAFYFGESAPGDGFISPADLSNLGAMLRGTGGSYLYCEPEDSAIQDLDGDAFLSPGDKATLGGMGRDFNYNNRDFLAEDTKQQWVSSDSRFVRYQ